MFDHFAEHRWPDPGPRVALLAVPEDGPPEEDAGAWQLATAAVRTWVRGWQHCMDPAVVAPIPPQWLHVPLVDLGPSRSAPPGLDDAIETRVVAQHRTRQGAERAPADRRLRHSNDGGRTGIAADIDDIGSVDLPMLGAAAAATAKALGVDADEVRLTQYPHLGLAYCYRGADWPWLSSWSRRGSAPWCYLRLRLLLVDQVQDVEQRCYTWTVRRTLPVVLRSSTVPDLVAITAWEQDLLSTTTILGLLEDMQRGTES